MAKKDMDQIWIFRIFEHVHQLFLVSHVDVSQKSWTSRTCNIWVEWMIVISPMDLGLTFDWLSMNKTDFPTSLAWLGRTPGRAAWSPSTLRVATDRDIGGLAMGFGTEISYRMKLGWTTIKGVGGFKDFWFNFWRVVGRMIQADEYVVREKPAARL